MADVSAGDVITVTKLNDRTGTVIKFLERGSASSTFTTTETPILRGDSIPFVTGRDYEIEMTPTPFSSSVAADVIDCRLRIDLTTTATITSTHIGSLVEAAKTSGGNQGVHGAIWKFTPGSTANGSLLISGIRVNGTGNCSLGSSISAYMMRVIVRDIGESVADSGVDL